MKQNKPFACTLSGVNSNKTDTTIKLKMSNKDAALFALNFLGSLDKEVIVQFGDPQMDIEDYDEPARGIPYKVAKDGTVDVPEKQVEMFNEGESEMELEDDEIVPDQSEEEAAGENGSDNSEAEAAPEDTGSDVAVEVDEESETVEPKDDVEDFVLSGKTFGDEEVDWATLLRRKKAGETWMEIASSIGVTSSKLSSAWNVYKKRVKAYLNSEENGAA